MPESIAGGISQVARFGDILNHYLASQVDFRFFVKLNPLFLGKGG